MNSLEVFLVDRKSLHQKSLYSTTIPATFFEAPLLTGTVGDLIFFTYM